MMKSALKSFISEIYANFAFYSLILSVLTSSHPQVKLVHQEDILLILYGCTYSSTYFYTVAIAHWS